MSPENVPQCDKYSQGTESNTHAGLFAVFVFSLWAGLVDESVASWVWFSSCAKMPDLQLLVGE